MTLPTTAHRAVLFDMNGVLVNDEELHELAFQQVLKPYIVLTHEQYLRWFAGRTDRDGFLRCAEVCGLSLHIETLLSTKAEHYEQLAAGHLRPYRGVVAFVQELDVCGWTLGLVTSSIAREVPAVLSAIGLASNFQVIVTADDIMTGKPDPEGYLKAATQLRIASTRCVVVEDAPSGIQAARRAGMKCLAVTNTHAADDLKEADHVLPQLDRSSVLLCEELIPRNTLNRQ